MRPLFVAAAIVAAMAGCGSAARRAAPAKCVVRIYFCTEVGCGRAATKAEIAAVSRRLRTDDDVFSVRLVSRREALKIMRRRHPDMTARLPSNPFPDSLRVRPIDGVGVRTVAAKARARKDGVHAVKFTRDPSCEAST